MTPGAGALHDSLTVSMPLLRAMRAGSSHHWTSDGASSVYSPTSESFRIYMFREGDDAGVRTCSVGEFSSPQAPCNTPNCGEQGYPACAHAQTGTGSGGGGALTAAGAMADNWQIMWIGVQN